MNLQEIDLRKVYRKWKSDLGPFQGFFRSTPFVSLQTYDDFMLIEENISKFNEKILKIILESCKSSEFLIIDLHINEILNLALILNNEYSIKPILNINLVFHPFGIIGSKEDINRLIGNGLKLKKINTEKFVMLIPYDRYKDELESENLSNKLNNQYGIGDDDLPDVEMLKELGYNKVIVLTYDNIKEDLKEYINLIDKDIEVEVMKVIL